MNRIELLVTAILETIKYLGYDIKTTSDDEAPILE